MKTNSKSANRFQKKSKIKVYQNSMVQMQHVIVIYSKEDLRGLLRCFLQLNSPSHHGIIVRAFSEIGQQVVKFSL
uniref:Transcription repressor n=1 Tax=Cucumis sativus TaxID=3659 RepID=A0A0A0LA93_CUCSA